MLILAIEELHTANFQITNRPLTREYNRADYQYVDSMTCLHWSSAPKHCVNLKLVNKNVMANKTKAGV